MTTTKATATTTTTTTNENDRDDDNDDANLFSDDLIVPTRVLIKANEPPTRRLMTSSPPTRRSKLVDHKN